MDIQQIRQQYPQYNSISDGELAFRLWNKDYKGRVPMGQFADSIKLSQQGFGEMVGIARQSGYEPTAESGSPAPIGVSTGAPRAALQGMTFGFGDELVGGMAGTASAARNVMQGRSPNLAGEVERFTGQERERIAQFQQESPSTALASELGGAIGASMIAPPIRGIQGLGSKTQAAITAGAGGALYGAGTGEGGLRERAQNSVSVAIPSAVFGGALQGAINVAPSIASKMTALFRRQAERPSVETLRNIKNAAYQAVEDSGLSFDQGQIQGLSSRAKQIAEEFDYVDDPAVFPETYAALKILDRRGQANKTTIGQLDAMRQALWQRYNRSQGSEPAIGRMIDEIDDLIQNYPDTSDLMNAARLANNQYKKAELLDFAMYKAGLQTAGTGSGGNILNKYKQAVTSILTNPKQIRFFNQQEIEQMENLVRGNISENALRRIGKLSPNGNGLMLALNVGAIAANPAMVGVTAAGAAAKALADRSGERAMQGLLNTVSGVPIRPAPQYTAGTGAAAASTTAQLQR